MAFEEQIPFYPESAEEIYRKKEFYDNKLLTENGREFSTSQPNLLKYQELVSRIAGQFTQYNKLLLFHEIGSGKTRSAISTVELARKQALSPLPKSLVLLNNKALINKFIRELVLKAEPLQYNPDPDDPLTRAILKKVRKNYDIMTFITFANGYEKDPEVTIQTYSHSIIIIDEVQQLVGERGGNDPYSLIHEFLHRVENPKILLMSGTPMKDTPDQFAMVMNLILDEQLPSGKDFKKAYFDGLYISEEGKESLKASLKNKISYISPPTSVLTKFMGKRMDASKIKFLKIYEDTMSDFQSGVYGSVLDSSSMTVGGDFNRPDRYASDFVFPDKTFGKGVSKFIKEDKGVLSLTDKFRDHLKGGDDNESLQNLKKYSCKYASTIQQILDNPDDVCFVYSESVGQGGIILLSLLLKDIFGFEIAITAKKNEKKRCALIYGSIEPHKITEMLDNMVNIPANMTGKICRVVLGSKVLTLGHDLMNIRQVHILTPHWNFSETEQVIGRAKRFNGNKALEDAGLDPTLRVFLHAAVSKRYESIDLKLWSI